MVGLVLSAAHRSGLELSANEVAQVLRAGADDIDFSTPNSFDRANELRDIYGQRRFPSVQGWDATHGYGRINAVEAVRLVTEGQIPPEADLTSPAWFSVLPVVGSVDIGGRVAASRSSSYSYRVEWTTGLQAPLHPGADQWRIVEERSGLSAPIEGTLAELDLARSPRRCPGAAPAHRPGLGC
jgi:hypothetical protein